MFFISINMQILHPNQYKISNTNMKLVYISLEECFSFYLVVISPSANDVSIHNRQKLWSSHIPYHLHWI